MTDLKNLIERLEKATGPDFDLDADVARFDGWVQPSNNGGSWAKDYGNNNVRWMVSAPHFTGSLDAAVTLVPEGASSWDCGRIDKDHYGSVEFPVDVDGFHNYRGKSAANEATALCIASLKARLSQDSTHD